MRDAEKVFPELPVEIFRSAVFSDTIVSAGVYCLMAWDAVQFRDQNGNLVGEKTRDTLLRLIEKALGTPDADPDVLINVASGVCANLGSVRNFAAYANRSIFRAARKAYVVEKKLETRLEPLPEDSRSLEGLTTSPEPVEDQILLQELLNHLNGLDREIYLRRLKGFSFVEIDTALNLKPRTSEYRFREAQLRLRKTLSTPPQ